MPGEWLDKDASRAEELRAAYARYLLARLAAPRDFVEEADRAR